MPFRVIKLFTDLQDNDHEYRVGDVYPRNGYTPTDARISQLSGSGNRQGVPLIEEIEETPKASEEQEEQEAQPKRARKPKAAQR